MIVVKRKNIEDIRDMIRGHNRVLLAGCNTCAAVSLAGGEREVEKLAAVLRLAGREEGRDQRLTTQVLQRQCEPEFVDEAAAASVDAVLSLACGAGVALMAERLDIPVYPALDTMFIGAARGYASWREECSACGECVLGHTGGICPVTRCAKGILNGPCGGTNEGKCEVDKAKECAWVLIYERLKALGRLDDFSETNPPKDASKRLRPRSLDLSGGFSAGEPTEEAPAEPKAGDAS